MFSTCSYRAGLLKPEPNPEIMFPWGTLLLLSWYALPGLVGERTMEGTHHKEQHGVCMWVSLWSLEASLFTLTVYCSFLAIIFFRAYQSLCTQPYDCPYQMARNTVAKMTQTIHRTGEGRKRLCLTGLKSRCHQSCVPLWKLSGNLFSCLFSFFRNLNLVPSIFKDRKRFLTPLIEDWTRFLCQVFWLAALILCAIGIPFVKSHMRFWGWGWM